MFIKDITLPNGLLTNAQMTLPSNKITVLLGQNGSGKSTLLAHLAQQWPEAAYLPQRNLVYDELTVGDLLALGQQRAKIALPIDIVASLELAPLLNKNLQQLSGGQQQRAWVAFILLQNAPIILLDEPLNALDLRYQQRLLTLLPQLSAQILLVVHDLNYARTIADWVWLLNQQQLTEGLPVQLLTATRLTEVFTTTITEMQAIDGTTFLKF